MALEHVFGALRPLSGAVSDSLVMALCRAYTGLANELAVITCTREEWRDIPGVVLPLLSVEALRERLVRETDRANADTKMAIPRFSLRQAAGTAQWHSAPADPRSCGLAYGYGHYRSPYETTTDRGWGGWSSHPLSLGGVELVWVYTLMNM